MRRKEIENGMSDRKPELVNLEKMTEYIANMQAVFREETLIERKAFIRRIIKDIRVSSDTAVLTHCIPKLPEIVSL